MGGNTQGGRGRPALPYLREGRKIRKWLERKGPSSDQKVKSKQRGNIAKRRKGMERRTFLLEVDI